MIKNLIVCLHFLFAISAIAQPGDSTKAKVLVVPFDPIMYINDIDRDIAKQTKMNFEQIRDSFRIELDRTIGEYLKSKYNTSAPYHLKMSEGRKDIEQMLSCISFHFEKDKSSNTGEKRQRSEIKNGQIKQVSDNGAKYMSAMVKDKDTFKKLCEKYNAAIVITVNQFEIKNDFASQEAVAKGELSRYIHVHYSVINAEGKTIGGGLAKSVAPTKTTNIKNISNENFTNISFEIMNCLEKAGSFKVKAN